MKVTVSDNQSQQDKEIKFPVLMRGADSTVVLFLTKTIGVVVDSHLLKEIGSYSETYRKFDDRNYWKPLPNGVKVTLENDL